MTNSRIFALMAVTLVVAYGCLAEVAPMTALQSTPPGGTGGTGGTGGALSLTAPPTVSAEATAPMSSVSLGNATASGGDNSYTITNDAPATGFALGAAMVTWTVTDGTGAQATATQDVMVSDTRGPMITTPPALQVLATGALTAVTLTQPAVSDLVDPNPTLSNNAPAAGYPLGTTVVVWTATDATGNMSTANQDVTLSTTPPAATGAELYATNCSGCHGPLATSTRRGRTATEITAALATVPEMSGITLTPAEIQLIADALANTTSSLVNVSLSANAATVNLNKNTTVTATITSVAGFSGPVDVSVTGMDPLYGVYVVEPSPTVTVPANGSVNVTLRFTTSVTSLSVNAAPLRLNIHDQNTMADIDGGSIAYTVNNLYELRFDPNSGTNGANHRWNGLRDTNLTLRPNTKLMWTNYDMTATHIVHGAGGIPHGPTNNSLLSPTIVGQRGQSYGANGAVGYYEQGQVTPLMSTNGALFYCHTHNDGKNITIVYDTSLTPHN